LRFGGTDTSGECDERDHRDRNLPERAPSTHARAALVYRANQVSTHDVR
jgi:hypothetical protein